jgi:hypothetical protein
MMATNNEKCSGPSLSRHPVPGESILYGCRKEFDDLHRIAAKMREIIEQGSITITKTVNTVATGNDNTGTADHAALQHLDYVSSRHTGFQPAGNYAVNPMNALGDMIYGGDSGYPEALAGNTAATRKFLRQLGTETASATPEWDTLQVGDLPSHNLLSATHGDTLSDSPVLGDLLIGNATPKWARLAGQTTATKKFLTQTGAGSVSATPGWNTIADTDLAAIGAGAQVIYNADGTQLAGDAGFTYDDDTNIASLAGGLDTPVVKNSSGNLQLLPCSDSAAICGDTGSGGTYRPLVIADQAYQTLASHEALYVGRNWPTSNGGYLARFETYPAGTSSSYGVEGVDIGITFNGANLVGGDSRVLRLAWNCNGSGIFPAPGAGVHPNCVIDLNVIAGADFSGSVGDMVGLSLHPYFDNNNITGSYTTVSMIRGLDNVQPSGSVTNLNWIDLPSVPNATHNNFIRFGGAGNIQLGGNISLTDTGNNVIATLDSAGKWGFGVVPALAIDICNSSLQATRSAADAYSQFFIFRKSRGSLEAPSGTQSGDLLGSVVATGYGTSGWNSASCSIQFKATQNHSSAAAGGQILFNVCPNNSISTILGMTIDQDKTLICAGNINLSALNIITDTSTGASFGSSATQKVGLHGAKAVQAAHIANPSGGTTVDTQARTAINAILVVLENKGLTASS